MTTPAKPNTNTGSNQGGSSRRRHSSPSAHPGLDRYADRPADCCPARPYIDQSFAALQENTPEAAGAALYSARQQIQCYPCSEHWLQLSNEQKDQQGLPRPGSSSLRTLLVPDGENDTAAAKDDSHSDPQG